MQSQLSMGLFRPFTSNVVICTTKHKPITAPQLSSSTYAFSISFRISVFLWDQLSASITWFVAFTVTFCFCGEWLLASFCPRGPCPSRATVQLFPHDRRAGSRTQHFPFHPASVFSLLEILILCQLKSHSQYCLDCI